ncbi:MerR family transcriptional regulator [Grimontia hollisae]|uniref:MerR family transcriptional regulator n=1 Tax=Grimontia hollisae TaxID=673 RepID=UPI000DF979EB|nr:MerR family transcriptional regulator [Grimontia hollisae]STQ76129.1 HTH-type transcriptional repressor YcgE [Grimontia hollisae]
MDSEEKLLTIGQVSEITGVNSVTLRAWQRRYGLIIPKRTPKGHRLYTEQDVQHIQEILTWLDKGVPVGQVKTLLGTSGNDVSDVQILPEWDALKKLVADFDVMAIEAMLYELTKNYPIQVLETKLLEPLTHWFDKQASDAGILCAQIWRAALNNVLVHCLHMNKKTKGKKRCWMVDVMREQNYRFYLKALSLQAEGYAVTFLGGVAVGVPILCQSLARKGISRLVIHSDQAFSPTQRRELLAIMESAEIDIDISGECTKIHPELTMTTRDVTQPHLLTDKHGV